MTKKRTYNKSSLTKTYDKPTTNTLLDRMRRNPLLTWISDMVRLTATDTIKVPVAYRDRVIETKIALNNDVSGLVNTVLDFAIDAALVEFTAQTKNKNLTDLLNDWMSNINSGMRGVIPVGVKALAKEYFRERWKGSSFLFLRTFWERKDGYNLPTTLYFLDGEDIVVDNPKNTVNLDGKAYYLRLGDKKEDWKRLPSKSNERDFIQKPYTSWGMDYPVPYLIQRGVWKNLKFLFALEEKSETVVKKALEYLALLKKGTEGLAVSGNPNVNYSEDELKKLSNSFKEMLATRKHAAGMSTYVTHFDTELEHIIPDYARALKQELYTPIERRILAGLGLVEVVQGITTTRRESTLNPKPFFAEVNTGIDDFKALLLDIMVTIAEENKTGHRKYFAQDIKIHNSIVKEELTKDLLTQIRSGYDRGTISKRSYSEALGYDLNTEIERRKLEKDTEKETYPPVIQNLEQFPKVDDNAPVADDKKGIEKKNYLKALEETNCPNCGAIFSFEEQDEVRVGVIKCPDCEEEIDSEDLLEQAFKPEITKNYVRLRQKSPSLFQKDSFRVIALSESKGIKAVVGRLKDQTTTTIQSYLFKKDKWNSKDAQDWVEKHQGSIEEISEIFGDPVDPRKDFEEAPYTMKNYPAQLKNLPSGARSVWINTFNSVYNDTHNENQARQAAWHNVKLKYKKSGDKWVKKSKGEIEIAVKELSVDELIKLKELELLGKRSKLVDKILKVNSEQENAQ